MKLADILRESCVIANIKGGTKREILFEMVETLKKEKLIDTGFCFGFSKDVLFG